MSTPFGTSALATAALFGIPLVIVVAAIGLMKEIHDWKNRRKRRVQGRGRMNIAVFFAWYDFWVGIYYDKQRHTIYICPFPTLVIKIARRKTHAQKK